MENQKLEKAIYLTTQTQYELKKIACTYHITLKALIPAILWYVANNKLDFNATFVEPGPRKLKHVAIDDVTFDRLKVHACENRIPFNLYLNMMILTVINEPYQSDTCEEMVEDFYKNIVDSYTKR